MSNGIQLHKADAYMVDRLTNAGLSAMERACLDITSSAEIVSAAFNILDRTLYALSDVADPDEAAHNREEIKVALNELLLSHGKLPN